MTDIVERSREIAYRPQSGDPDDLTFEDFLDASAALLDAADEIERLRQCLSDTNDSGDRTADRRDTKFTDQYGTLSASEATDSTTIKEAMDASQIDITNQVGTLITSEIVDSAIIR